MEEQQAKQRVVIIGNGMVGHKLCEEISRLPSRDLLDVTVFGEEPRPAYDRVHLSHYFSHRDEHRLTLSPKEWYAGNGLNLITNNPVVEIDRAERVVKPRDGEPVPYDALALATGSRAFVPDIKGADLPGVFVYRTIEDLKAIEQYATNAKRAAVLGGGILGLEAAKALHDMQIKTHIVEIAAFLMPKQLDETGSDLLRKKVRSMGIKVYLNRFTESVYECDNELVLCFKDGSCLAVDMVVISAGIRPRDELARACGLPCGPGGGVVVNDRLQTGDPYIYAVGECANYGGRVYGLVSPGYRMARALANRLVGGDDLFTGADLSFRLKMLGVDVAHLGQGLQPGRRIVYQAPGVYRKLVLERNQLIGVISVGEWDELPAVESLIDEKEILPRSMIQRFRAQGVLREPGEEPNVWDALPDTAKICNCMSVTKAELLAAFQSGCSSAAALAENTGASTVCGSCRPQLEALCGNSGAVSAPPTKSRWLLGVSVTAAVFVLALFVIPPLPFAASVQDSWHSVDLLWRDGILKQVSGYCILTLSCFALFFSLRKRWKRVTFGDYGIWRIVHAGLGVLALALLPVHTGFRMGANLNYWLMLFFILFGAAGAVAGAAAALETVNHPKIRRYAFRYRPLLTGLHIYLFWVIPVLLAFHILKIYYF